MTQKKVFAILLALFALIFLGCTATVLNPLIQYDNSKVSSLLIESESATSPSASSSELLPVETPALSSAAAASEVPDPSSEPVSTPVPTPVSIVWIPDTQRYSYSYPERLNTLGTWIKDHAVSDNIIAVVHTGDIVDNGFKQWEWENFDSCLKEFRDDIPFFPVAGNHDLGVKLGEYGGYLSQSFLASFPEEQKYQGGKMLYTVLDAGTTKILLLGIGWEMGKTTEEIDWIDAVMQDHSDIPCIVVTHAYRIEPDRILTAGEQIESNIIAKYPNVHLVLCGHVRQKFFTAQHEYDDDGDGRSDRTVHTLMLNAQDSLFLYRMLTFDPVSGSLSVKTYRLGSDETVPANGYGPADFVLNHVFEDADQTESSSLPAAESTPLSSSEPTAASVSEKEQGRKIVALTFDDGPRPGRTNLILDILEQYGARATFFVLGSSINDTSAPLLQRMVDLNCEIGIHGLDHTTMTKLNYESQVNRLNKMKEIISERIEGGYELHLMRPPGGAQTVRVRKAAETAGLAVILWSVDSTDWEVLNRDKILEVCKRKIRNGSIILMHDKLQATRAAVAELVPYLQEQGYELVTISELFEYTGTALEAGVVYRENSALSE